MENKTAPFFSVIIPVYNVESYIEQCIDSILRQSFKNFELILINDGSTDGSPDICKKLSEEDIRIKYISKQNEGVSKTRNLGINVATGKYICFIDSDDYLEEDFLINLYNHAQDDSDMIVSNWKILNNGKLANSHLNFPENLNQTHTIHKEHFRIINQIVYIWSSTYKNDIIKSYKLKFDEKMDYCEDVLFFISYFDKCHTISFSNNHSYIHRISNSGLSCKSYQFEKELYAFNRLVPFRLYLGRKFSVKSSEGIDVSSYQSILRVTNSLYKGNNYSFNYRIDKLKFLQKNYPDAYKRLWKMVKPGLNNLFIETLLLHYKAIYIYDIYKRIKQ